MHQLTAFLRRSTLARYILVGGTGFVIELLVLFGATELLGWSNLVAVTLSFWIGIVASFFLQKTVAFGSTGLGFSTLSVQAALYALLIVINFLFSLWITSLIAGTVGVYVARAIALLITTVWNFGAYKWIIFNERLTGPMSSRFSSGVSGSLRSLTTHTLTLALTLAVSLSVAVILLATLASPVADDYFYFTQIDRAGSPWAFAVEHFSTQNGRFVQALTVGISYSLFGTAAVTVVPIALFLALTLALACNLRFLVPFAMRPWLSSLALSASLTALSLIMAPSLFDTYLWLTSSTVYLGSILALLCGSALTITLFRRPRTRAVLVPVTMLVLCSAQMFSEPTSLFAIGLWGVIMLVVLVTKNWQMLWVTALLWASLIAGFLLSFFSPGTQLRREVVSEPLNLVSAVANSFTHFRDLASTITLWMLLLTFATIILAVVNIDPQKLSRRTSLWAASGAFVMLLGSTFGVFLASEIGSTYYPWRNFTLPVWGALVFGTLLVIFLVGPIRGSLPAVVPGVAVLAAIVCACVAAPAFFNFWSLQANGLALRASAIEQRNASVAEQLAQGETSITVPAAPVLVRSDANEIMNPDHGQIEWIIGPYRELAGIPAERSIEVTATPESYCLPVSALVKPEFVCK